MTRQIVYEATYTGTLFHAATDFVRGIVGPIGSGKSVMCCWELMQLMQKQKPNEEGIRKTRFAVIRNSYRELQDTTIQTYFDWFPKDMGTFKVSDMTHVIDMRMPDGTRIYSEILFRALDRPDDIKKLLSLELTAAWVNEARHVPKAVIDMLIGRLGRYPSKREGGPSWYGLIMDTNPPDVDHWWYRMFEELRPRGWRIFHQPSGLSAEAENVENLPPGYYLNMMAGKDQEWINVYVHGRYGFVMDGKPVYPQYHDDIHHINSPLDIVSNMIYVGLDFGLTPAAVTLQKTGTGQWQALDELVTEDMSTLQFGPELAGLLKSPRYRGCSFEITGDPSGEIGNQATKETCFEILQAQNLPANPAETNDPELRRNVIVRRLTTNTIAGEPGLIIGSNCRMLRKGMAGGFKYRRVQVTGAERFTDKPDKNIYSHVCEAMEYALLGAGEGHALLMPKHGKNYRPPRVKDSRGRYRDGMRRH